MLFYLCLSFASIISLIGNKGYLCLCCYKLKSKNQERKLRFTHILLFSILTGTVYKIITTSIIISNKINAKIGSEILSFILFDVFLYDIHFGLILLIYSKVINGILFTSIIIAFFPNLSKWQNFFGYHESKIINTSSTPRTSPNITLYINNNLSKDNHPNNHLDNQNNNDLDNRNNNDLDNRNNNDLDNRNNNDLDNRNNNDLDNHNNDLDKHNNNDIDYQNNNNLDSRNSQDKDQNNGDDDNQGNCDKDNQYNDQNNCYQDNKDNDQDNCYQDNKDNDQDNKDNDQDNKDNDQDNKDND